MGPSLSRNLLAEVSEADRSNGLTPRERMAFAMGRQPPGGRWLGRQAPWSDLLVMDVLGVKASQARCITNPIAGVQQAHSDASRIKMLAERYLARGEA